MPKKSLLPVLSLAMLSLAAPQALWTQEEDDPASSKANISLETMVVTASRTEEPLREVTSSITVIDSKTIERSTAQTLDSLLMQNGIFVSNTPGSTGTISLRGFVTDAHGNDLGSHVLILLDGRRIATGTVGMLDLANVERVEVLRGPGAVQYGAAAMGGVVNVISKKGVGQPFTASLEAGIGRFDLHRGVAKLNGSEGNFDFSAGLRYEEAGDYKIGGKGPTYKNTDYENFALNTTLGYTFLERHRLGLSVYYFDSPDNGMPGSIDELHKDEASKKNYLVGLDYTGSTEDGRWSWLVNYNIGEDKLFYDYPPNDPYGNADTWNDTKNYSGKAQLTFDNELFSLTGGVDYLRYVTDNRGGAMSAKAAEYENMALFAIGKLRLLDDRLIFSAGGRFDHFDLEAKDINRKTKKDNFSPSVGLAYHPTDWLKLRAHYAQAFAMPTPSQLSSNFNYWGTHYLGNPDLDPETSDSYEFGLDLTGAHTNFSATYFWSKTKDYISGQAVDPGWAEYSYFNMDKAYRSGLEVSFSTDIGGLLGRNFELRPTFSWTHMFKYKTRLNRDSAYTHITLVPENIFSYGLTFHQPEIDLTVDLRFTRTGDQYYSNSNSNDQQMDPYTLADLMVKKRVLDFGDNGKLDVKLAVDNMFDKQYVTNTLFSPTSSPYYMPGRSYYLGLVYSY